MPSLARSLRRLVGRQLLLSARRSDEASSCTAMSGLPGSPAASPGAFRRLFTKFFRRHVDFLAGKAPERSPRRNQEFLCFRMRRWMPHCVRYQFAEMLALFERFLPLSSAASPQRRSRSAPVPGEHMQPASGFQHYQYSRLDPTCCIEDDKSAKAGALTAAWARAMAPYA